MRKCEVLWLSILLSACGSGEVYQQSSLQHEAVEEQHEAVEEQQEERLSLVDPGKTGPYQVLTYTPKAAASGYRSALIYYPRDQAGTQLPAMTLSGGFTNTKEQMSWLGRHLASHGIVTIIFTPTSTTTGSAQIWANGHKASVETLHKEERSFGSPLYGRINLDRVGVSGYSYGGAGAILAANQSPDKVAAAIPLCAYQPSRPSSPIPYLFVTGTRDSVASPAAILNVFNRTSTGKPKAYAKFSGVSHFDMINGGRYQESVRRYITAWALRFLADHVDYGTYINGEIAKKQALDKTIFASSNDYIYRD